MSESEYSKLFNSIAKECDIENLSEHTLGALFWDHQQEKIEKLQAEKEKLIRCVEFYADVNNWKSGFSLKVDDTKLTKTNQLRRGGKRARQCLQELKEGKNE